MLRILKQICCCGSARPEPEESKALLALPAKPKHVRFAQETRIPAPKRAHLRSPLRPPQQDFLLEGLPPPMITMGIHVQPLGAPPERYGAMASTITIPTEAISILVTPPLDADELTGS